MQTPRRALAAPRDVVVPAGWGFAGRRAPDETETPREPLASLWLTWQGAEGGGGGGDGGGGTLEDCPHPVVGSSPAGGAEVAGDDWNDEKGRDEAHDHQKTILRREEEEEEVDKDGRRLFVL